MPATASAVLDIGEATGALVIYAARELLGEEIEICPEGRPDRRIHNVVRARRTLAATVYAAVFPALAEGTYDVLDLQGATSSTVCVQGGRVVEVGAAGEPV